MNQLISTEEAKVLFALLDAADDDGLLQRCGLEKRWREVRRQIADVPTDSESGVLWNLLLKLERSGVLAGTWILDRWGAIEKQVVRSSVLAEEARHTPPIFRR